MKIRKLREGENNLINFLIKHIPYPHKEYLFSDKIIEMDDGGMGSLKFINENESKYSRNLIEAEYLDKDEIPVLITLMEDKLGQLFELDIWKVNYSPLIQFPKPENLKIGLRK